MAVRHFDQSQARPHLTLVEPAPRRRHDVRRSRQRIATLAVIALATPFAFAAVLLGAGH